MNAHQVTREFEAELCRYTGAPYAVAVNSCTAALMLAVAWHMQKRGITPDATCFEWDQRPYIEIPKRTYASVPMSIIHGGGRPAFRDEQWSGFYQLKPLPVWDCARWFSGGMYERLGGFVCVSCHSSKSLGDTQGGAVLHADQEADRWLRRARFDGRTEGVAPKEDRFDMVGWHCYLSPDVATRLLWKLASLPKHNEPLPNDDYPDMSEFFGSGGGA